MGLGLQEVTCTHVQYMTLVFLHVLLQLFVYLPDSGEQLKVGDLEITVDRMEYKTGYILRNITIAMEQVGGELPACYNMYASTYIHVFVLL